MPRPEPPRLTVGPASVPEWIVEAVLAGGAQIVEPEDAEGLIWGSPRDTIGLVETLARAPHVRWVQLPFAGIEPYREVLDSRYTWTCGKGVYAEPVAELALTLALAGMRGLSTYARADSWEAPRGTNLLGARVTILGGGGITESLLRLLQPFGCHVTVVRRRADHLEGADVVVEADKYAHALPGADLVVLALALTPETEGIIGAEELALMDDHAWLVNVARGRHIVTDDLVDALRDGVIGGAGLDVTDPEPLPDDHPLWSLDNCIITPHIGNTPEMARPLLAERLRANVRRFADDEPLLGLVDVELGY